MVETNFKQTEIGLIPEDWDVVSLGEIGYTIIGLTYKPSDVQQYGTLVLRSSNVQQNRLKYSDNVYVQMDLPQRVIVKEKDILICVRNGSKHLIGKCAIIDKNAEGMAFGAFMSIYRSQINDFIFHQFQSQIIQMQIDEIMGATINQITNKDLNSFKISIPPLNEQQSIATALSDTDAWIQSLEKLVAKKRLIKQGAMQQLLTPKKDWEVKKLIEFGKVLVGLTYSPNDVREHGTLVLRSSNIQNNKLAFENNVFVDMELPARVIVEENDLLICVRNGSRDLIGKCTLIDKKTAGQAFGAFMSVFRSEYNRFVFYLFQSQEIKRQIDENLGATINQITNKMINNFEVTIPKPEEQLNIANILSDMDSEIDILENKLQKAQQIKQGMMQQLLTGKIRLVAANKAVSNKEEVTAS